MKKIYKTEIGEWKENPIITLFTKSEGAQEWKKVISFGLSKAEAIINCIDEIKKFINDNKKG